MEVTIGGDRLGSGKKQKTELNSYGRSSFNQEQDWKSSMAPGVLYPFLCIPMTNGDSMDIDLDAFVRTIATKGPLFGSFKLQADLFSIPMRLYNGVLHNNPTRIGMSMNQIYTPKIVLQTKNLPNPGADWANYDFESMYKMNESSLMKYLGLSGIGIPEAQGGSPKATKYRKINAIPALGYYDIFKTYYSNKQEENAYVIGVKEHDQEEIALLQVQDFVSGEEIPSAVSGSEVTVHYQLYWKKEIIRLTFAEPVTYDQIHNLHIYCEDTNGEGVYDEKLGELPEGSITIIGNTDEIKDVWDIQINNPIEIPSTDAETAIIAKMEFDYVQIAPHTEELALLPFNLQNLDDMRMNILSYAEIGYEYKIGEGKDWGENSGQDSTGLPYSALFNWTTSEGNQKPWNTYPLNGLLVKTYQSDLFNNWIDTEWIDGENGISAISAVDVSGGSLKMDALNLAQKVYDMFNRIAVSGGTYEDWQQVTYDENAVRKAESPIYEGGMSAEIMFEEVIANSESQIAGQEPQALGALGGKGTMINQNGGHEIHIKAREPIFVMGIVSITPRICYTQGNEWYLTDIDTFDDLHKPALDGIGFQDLIGEQMDWRDTKLQTISDQTKIIRTSPGKVVAWSNYMTAVDKAYGDFAKNDGKAFMVLSRDYAYDIETRQVTDFTTYIDPAKYNYAFAYTNLEAQNFWVQLHSKVITRRVMSAKQIPNL